jgi:hypothetical protein
MAGRLAARRAATAYHRARHAGCHQREPSLFSPRPYTGKTPRRKLFDANPLFRILGDKLAVPAYISARAGANLRHNHPIFSKG